VARQAALDLAALDLAALDLAALDLAAQAQSWPSRRSSASSIVPS
jgi:hypothetical protein